MEVKYINKRKINIIDPSSTEFNRGSFCYAPYLLYNGLADTDDVVLYETFIPENLDTIRDADYQIICLWSYPQIEASIFLEQFLSLQYGKDNVFFVGYSPLIRKENFRHIQELFLFDPLSDVNFLKLAMKNYPKYFSHFKRLLLSDCDMHLNSLERNHKVYPLFTTYGCPNGCAFCPSTKNCGLKRVELSLEDCQNLLKNCEDSGIHYIHFTDEDFFYDIDRAYSVLSYMKNRGFHTIALGSADKVLSFVEKYTEQPIKDAGLEVIEIGFESGEEAISAAMGSGKSLNSCEKLAKMQKEFSFRIFWLILTFFPGETIKSLNKTGEFLELYGFDMDEVVGRLKTNGTKGGLGQFFQPYHGLRIFDRLQGTFLTPRPIRLIPGFVPNSFLDSVITEINLENLEKATIWLNLYRVNLPVNNLIVGRTLRSYMEHDEILQKSIFFAILARWRVIS